MMFLHPKSTDTEVSYVSYKVPVSFSGFSMKATRSMQSKFLAPNDSKTIFPRDVKWKGEFRGDSHSRKENSDVSILRKCKRRALETLGRKRWVGSVKWLQSGKLEVGRQTWLSCAAATGGHSRKSIQPFTRDCEIEPSLTEI